MNDLPLAPAEPAIASLPALPTAAPATVDPYSQPPLYGLPPECVPDMSDVDIETEEPVESWLAEREYRLLTEPLYSSWAGPGAGRPFMVCANVGLFHTMNAPAIVPDVMLSLDVRFPESSVKKENRTYVTWILGKVPDAVVEIVSDLRGGEAGLKMQQYARLNIPYYAIFDPRGVLRQGLLRCFEKVGTDYRLRPDNFFPGIGLGLKVWEGMFEAFHAKYIRWCDADGNLIPTGAERAEQECQRAEQERQRGDDEQQHRRRLEAKLRELGVDPNTIS